ncbi:MAG: A/G-specific adenine glycosylase [Ruminiclostridium sp.]|nr:A/G-specific adenine glycosylase [Ruminiclostridium sp.]
MNTLSMLPIPLLAWYQDNARDLPWRREVTAYRVWVSEIMLQQTRVAAVLGYFARFMEAFPTVADLAAAPEEQLMKLWQGLGYYSRARNLQKAAKQIMTEFDGVFPTEYKDLRRLAGVGEYTAAAIASIAYGQPLPAVDGNLLRVTARVLGDGTDITSGKGKKHFTELLQAVMPLEQPGRFNQAMMDLGATVCLPNGAPLCERCPARDFCVARAQDRTGSLPVRPEKKPRRIEARTVYFFTNQGRVALRQRPGKGLLAGLWEYPNTLEAEGDPLPAWGFSGVEPQFAGTGKHIFTHVEWHMTALRCELPEDALPVGWVWADREARQSRYAIPSAFAPFQDLVEGVGL